MWTVATTPRPARSRHLGTKIEFDAAGGTLTLRGLPTQLTDQLKRAAA